MTEVQQLAEFVVHADASRLSDAANEQLRIRVLDTIGVAIGAQDAEPVRAIRELTDQLGGNPLATLIGGGATAPDRAAFYNTALSRYLDFMDSYLAPGETNHPSDNLGAVLAAAQLAGATGAEFLVALAVAYQVHTRLSDVAPVRDRGFDHTVQGAYAVAAGASKALGLNAAQTANAIAIAGTANNALRVTRTGRLSHWKALAYPQVAKEGLHAALLARAGITGPAEVFEGTKGLKDSITGPFTIDWSAEDLESVRRTIIKKHNAEIHSQSAIEAALDVAAQPGFDARAIHRVGVTTFQVAFDIIGGGLEGDKHLVVTKEEADHSLPYLVAVALLDRQVQPEQFRPERIVAPDVQRLLGHTTVVPDADFSAIFPSRMPSRVEVTLDTGEVLTSERSDYEGFHTNPLDWAGARAKFERLAAPYTSPELRDRIAETIHGLGDEPITELTELLAQVDNRPSAPAAIDHPALSRS